MNGNTNGNNGANIVAVSSPSSQATGAPSKHETYDGKQIDATAVNIMNLLPTSAQCALTFTDLKVSTTGINSHVVLQPISGLVRKGGITAVLGASSSGKTLLLRVLAGRETLLQSTGTVVCGDKTVKPSLGPMMMGFVAQEDHHLLGELTPREVITFNARLGAAANSSTEAINKLVQEIIDGLGLTAVADNIIGTVLKRGLSGGEKRRVSVGCVLATLPQVLLIDEPTSGLDGAIAFTVIESIKQLARAHDIGVLLSVHQPSARILELFEDLIILENGHTVYAGPTAASVSHFEQLGYACPEMFTPTDHFLAVVRKSSKTVINGFQTSPVKTVMKQHLQSMTKTTQLGVSNYAAPFYTQVQVIVERSFLISHRDVTLYAFQMNMAAMFAFMAGACFFGLPRVIGHRIEDQSNGITWLDFIAAFLQIFKVYHLYTNQIRAADEHSNQLYSYTSFAVSSFLTSAFFAFVVYVPCLLIGYGMMGYPLPAIGYVIFSFWLTAWTSESMLEVACLLSVNLPVAILVSQALMVVLCVYAGASFIPWSSLGFWVWLSELSLFTWSSRGQLISVFSHFIFACPSDFLINDSCLYNGINYPCDPALSTNGTCNVDGLDVLRLFKGVTETDEWFQVGILILLMGCFRIITYLLLLYPASSIWHSVTAHIPYMNSTPGSTIDLVTSPQSVQNGEEQDVQQVAPAIQRVSSIREVKDIELSFQNVSLNLYNKNGKLLIDNICGVAKSGRVLAVMGPSGAGKTTFLNALAARAPYAVISGSVMLGGEVISMKYLSYVPQFDCLDPSFTPTQLFWYTARLQQATINDKTSQFIEELIDILDLQNVRHTRIESLSSSVRKRCSIAVGILSKPVVLLLDEPTTGLDSTTSAIIIQYIIKVTRRTGVICILTIHQPSSQLFSSMDDLLLLSKGQQAYFGPMHQVASYFAGFGFRTATNANPADLYLDLMNATPAEIEQIKVSGGGKITKSVAAEAEEKENASKGAVVPWRQMYDSSDLGAAQNQANKTLDKADVQAFAEVRPTEFLRLLYLVKARSQLFLRDPSVYSIRLFELIILGVFTGTLFLQLSKSIFSVQQLGGALFFNMWSVLFMAITVIPFLTRDRLTFENEMLNRTYGVSTFLLANFLASIPFQLISSFVLQALVWWLVGFNNGGENYIFSVFSVFALFLLMEGIALCIVQLLKNAMLSTTFSMNALGMLFLFPGFFISKADMPVSISWASFVVPTHYSFNSQLYNIFGGQTYDDGQGGIISGETILSEYYNVNHAYSKWLDFFIVLVYMFGIRMMHYMLLKMEYWNYSHTKRTV